MPAKIKQKLLGCAGVQFPPQLGEKRGEWPVENLEPVDKGVVGRAEDDEQARPGDARFAVVNMETLRYLGFLADPAGVAVAGENSQP